MRAARARLAVVGTLFLLAGSGCAVRPGAGSTSVPPHPAPTSAVASASPSATIPTPTTLGPNGVGELTLGMTKAQAAETGLTTGITGATGACGGAGDGRLVGALPADESDLDGKLFFSVDSGRLEIIGATSALATPEGIHLGSTLAEVKKAYPKWKPFTGAEGVAYLKVAGNPKAYYRIYVDVGQVMELTLQSADQGCAE